MMDTLPMEAGPSDATVSSTKISVTASESTDNSRPASREEVLVNGDATVETSGHETDILDANDQCAIDEAMAESNFLASPHVDNDGQPLNGPIICSVSPDISSSEVALNGFGVPAGLGEEDSTDPAEQTDFDGIDDEPINSEMAPEALDAAGDFDDEADKDVEIVMGAADDEFGDAEMSDDVTNRSSSHLHLQLHLSDTDVDTDHFNDSDERLSHADDTNDAATLHDVEFVDDDEQTLENPVFLEQSIAEPDSSVDALLIVADHSGDENASEDMTALLPDDSTLAVDAPSDLSPVADGSDEAGHSDYHAAHSSAPIVSERCIGEDGSHYLMEVHEEAQDSSDDGADVNAADKHPVLEEPHLSSIDPCSESAPESHAVGIDEHSADNTVVVASVASLVSELESESLISSSVADDKMADSKEPSSSTEDRSLADVEQCLDNMANIVSDSIASANDIPETISKVEECDSNTDVDLVVDGSDLEPICSSTVNLKGDVIEIAEAAPSDPVVRPPEKAAEEKQTNLFENFGISLTSAPKPDASSTIHHPPSTTAVSAEALKHTPMPSLDKIDSSRLECIRSLIANITRVDAPKSPSTIVSATASSTIGAASSPATPKQAISGVPSGISVYPSAGTAIFPKTTSALLPSINQKTTLHLNQQILPTTGSINNSQRTVLTKTVMPPAYPSSSINLSSAPSVTASGSPIAFTANAAGAQKVNSSQPPQQFRVLNNRPTAQQQQQQFIQQQQQQWNANRQQQQRSSGGGNDVTILSSSGPNLMAYSNLSPNNNRLAAGGGHRKAMPNVVVSTRPVAPTAATSLPANSAASQNPNLNRMLNSATRPGLLPPQAKPVQPGNSNARGGNNNFGHNFVSMNTMISGVPVPAQGFAAGVGSLQGQSVRPGAGPVANNSKNTAAFVPAQSISMPRMSVGPASSRSANVKVSTMPLAELHPQQQQQLQKQSTADAAAAFEQQSSSGGCSCLECGCQFSLKSSLEFHYQRRSVVISIVCIPCNVALVFFNQCAYKDHIRQHKLAGYPDRQPVIAPASYQIRAMASDAEKFGAFQSPAFKRLLDLKELYEYEFNKPCFGLQEKPAAVASASLAGRSPAAANGPPPLRNQQNIISMPNLTGKATFSQNQAATISNVTMTMTSNNSVAMSRAPTQSSIAKPQSGISAANSNSIVQVAASSLRTVAGAQGSSLTSLSSVARPAGPSSSAPVATVAPTISLKCSECAAPMASAAVLQLHFAYNLPPTQKQFICQKCQAVYFSSCSYKAHCRSHAPGTPGPHICAECGLSLSSAPSLTSHVLSHRLSPTVLDAWRCQKCYTFYSAWEALIAHVAALHCESYVKCPACPKAFRNQATFTEHRTADHPGLTATPDAITTCPTCHAVCRDRSQLIGHIKKHYSAISPFQVFRCPICGRLMENRSGLLTHYKNVHKITLEPNNIVEYRPQQEKEKLEQSDPSQALEQNPRLVNIAPKPPSQQQLTTSASQLASSSATSSSSGLQLRPVAPTVVNGNASNIVKLPHTSPQRPTQINANTLTPNQSGTNGSNAVRPSNAGLAIQQQQQQSRIQRLPQQQSANASIASTQASNNPSATTVAQANNSPLLKMSLFNCRYCPAMLFRSDVELKKHMEQKHSIFCKKCKSAFLSKEEKVADGIQHLKDGQLVCLLCDNAPYESKQRLANHLPFHISPNAAFLCSIHCNGKFPQRNEAINHMRLVHMLPELRCPDCSTLMDSEKSLDIHRWICQQNRQQQENARGGAASSSSEGGQPLNLNGKRPAAASAENGSDEGPSTAKLPRLATGEVASSTKAAEFQCGKCHVTFASRASLQEHIPAHRQAGYLQCLECGLCFASELSIGRHLSATHKISDVQGYLKQHEAAKASPEKTSEHQCDVCQLACESQAELSAHVKTHGLRFLKAKTATTPTLNKETV